MAELPHRDIFVGIIAESLAKDGYFGVEIDFYVFYAWEGEMRTYFLENEEECVRKMLDLAAKGICVSDYVLYKAHLLQDTAVMRNQALTCAEEKLAERESAAFAARVEKYEALGENLHEQEFEKYLSSLNADKNCLITGILILGLNKKLITPAFAVKWRPKEETAKKWAGFFYRQNDKTICYANAYLPNVWQKWRGIADEGYLVSGIISADVAQDKPLYQQKEDFLHYLESVAEEFFSFWQSL